MLRAPARRAASMLGSVGRCSHTASQMARPGTRAEDLIEQLLCLLSESQGPQAPSRRCTAAERMARWRA